MLWKIFDLPWQRRICNLRIPNLAFKSTFGISSSEHDLGHHPGRVTWICTGISICIEMEPENVLGAELERLQQQLEMLHSAQPAGDDHSPREGDHEISSTPMPGQRGAGPAAGASANRSGPSAHWERHEVQLDQRRSTSSGQEEYGGGREESLPDILNRIKGGEKEKRGSHSFKSIISNIGNEFSNSFSRKGSSGASRRARSGGGDSVTCFDTLTCFLFSKRTGSASQALPESDRASPLPQHAPASRLSVVHSEAYKSTERSALSSHHATSEDNNMPLALPSHTSAEGETLLDWLDATDDHEPPTSRRHRPQPQVTNPGGGMIFRDTRTLR